MSRELSTGINASIGDTLIRPVLFVEAQFRDGFVRYWTGYGPLEYLSRQWQGAGELLGFSAVGETADLRAVGATISLAGVTTNVALVLAQAQRGLPVNVWLGLLDDAGQVLDVPYVAFSGQLDTCTIDDNGLTSTVVVAYENELIDLTRARVRRYTLQDQQLRAPGDRSFEFTPYLQDRVWNF